MKAPRTCLVAECSDPTARLGRCETHYAAWRRAIDSPLPTPRPVPPSGSLSPAWRGSDIGYAAMHDRVKTARGAAANHSCVDCQGTAAHWSYDHLDPEERVQPDGRTPSPYSLKIEHYQPRCAQCHARFDHANSGGLTAEQAARIREMHAEGNTQRVIARAVKLATVTVADVIHGRRTAANSRTGGAA